MKNAPEIRNVDIAIIGTGSAGMSAYKTAREFTDSIVVIEGEHYGTTCARVGCMPSKLLIAAAEAAHHLTEAARFGVVSGHVAVDRKAVMERVRSERDRFVGFVQEDVANWPEAHRLFGHAKFVDPHTLDVGGHTIVKAQRIIIATGSRPSFPLPWAELGDRLIVNDNVFDWEELPESVAVFGNGVIGLELAQSLHRLGVRIRLFGLGGLVGPLTDPEVTAAARAAFAAEYPFDPEAKTSNISREGDSVVITFEEDGETKTERFDFLLAATGRRPNTDKLALENSGLELDERGTPVGYDHTTTRLGTSHIFIAGDAAQDIPLLHEASDTGRIAGENAARYPFVREQRRRTPLGVAFSDPQIALVGDTRRALDAAGADYRVGTVDFTGQGRSRVMGKNVGRLNVYGDAATGRFLGAEMVGPAAEHIGHLLAWAHQAELTVQDMLDSPFYHPVIEEGVRTALRDLRDAIAIKPTVDCIDCRRSAWG